MVFSNSACFSRSLAITASGALPTNFSLFSLPATRSKSFCTFSICLLIRVISASLSIRPAIGIKISMLPNSDVAEIGASSFSLRIVIASSFASELRNCWFSSRRRCSSVPTFLSKIEIGLLGLMSISPRMLRIAIMNCLTHSRSCIDCASTLAASCSGNACSMIVAPSVYLPASGATRCQISSVMNGMIGCIKRCNASRIVTNV